MLSQSLEYNGAINKVKHIIIIIKYYICSTNASYLPKSISINYL